VSIEILLFIFRIRIVNWYLMLVVHILIFNVSQFIHFLSYTIFLKKNLCIIYHGKYSFII